MTHRHQQTLVPAHRSALGLDLDLIHEPVPAPPPRASSRWISVGGGGVPDSDGSLRLLGCEPQLGSRPVTLWLRLNGPEGQVDPWASVMVLFSHLMLVETETDVSTEGNLKLTRRLLCLLLLLIVT